jgi:hypothetical protein
MSEPVPGLDFLYGDLEGDRDKSTVERCSQACLLRSECVAFTYVPHAGQNRKCWLKHTTSGRKAADMRVSSGVKESRTYDPADVLSLNPAQ